MLGGLKLNLFLCVLDHRPLLFIVVTTISMEEPLALLQHMAATQQTMTGLLVSSVLNPLRIPTIWLGKGFKPQADGSLTILTVIGVQLLGAHLVFPPAPAIAHALSQRAILTSANVNVQGL